MLDLVLLGRVKDLAIAAKAARNEDGFIPEDGSEFADLVFAIDGLGLVYSYSSTVVARELIRHNPCQTLDQVGFCINEKEKAYFREKNSEPWQDIYGVSR